MTTIRIRRLPAYPGPDLVIHNAEELARTFFKYDLSGGFGLAVGDPHAVNLEDIRTLNTVMRARSSHRWWSDLTGAGPLLWLRAIDPGWDLIEMENEMWHGQARESASAALQKTIQAQRGRAVATKLLHMKRHRLFPILDGLVVQQLGAPTEGGPQPIVLMDHLRSEGRRNFGGLQEVQGLLRKETGFRSLIRILDALLWSAHPASSMAPNLTSWVRSFGT